jgi:hypothetical protein
MFICRCVFWSTIGIFIRWGCILQHTWIVQMWGVYSAAHVDCSNVGGVLWSTRGMFICRCVLWSTCGIFVCRVCIPQHTWNVNMSGVYYATHVEFSDMGVYSGAHVECTYVECVLYSTRGIFICQCVLWKSRGMFIYRCVLHSS